MLVVVLGLTVGGMVSGLGLRAQCLGSGLGFRAYGLGPLRSGNLVSWSNPAEVPKQKRKTQLLTCKVWGHKTGCWGLKPEFGRNPGLKGSFGHV